MNPLEVVQLSTKYLRDHGSDSARLDAEVLVSTALEIQRLDLYLQFDRPLDETELSSIRELVRRRGVGEPVAYIVGRREFYGRAFTVNAEVLIPRPETETLIEAALLHVREHFGEDGKGVRILDLGTGSGCIAVTLASELPEASVVATDVSPGALQVAKQNSEANQVVGQVEFVSGSWFDAVKAREFDVVVSNPPYITTEEMASLAPNVGDFEPKSALHGGDDGLDPYRVMAGGLNTVVPDANWAAFFEVDSNRASQTAALFPYSTTVLNDLAGRPRVVVVTPKS